MKLQLNWEKQYLIKTPVYFTIPYNYQYKNMIKNIIIFGMHNNIQGKCEWIWRVIYRNSNKADNNIIAKINLLFWM